MSGMEPSEKDIENLFKRLRSIPANKFCFDCGAKNPTWASVTYGVFICIDCSAVHRSLGVHLTFVRSSIFDKNWTWIQLHKMQLGGNSNAKLFFVQHNCTTKDFQTKYNSRTAQLYKEKLESAANQAIALHGHTLNLEPEPPVDEKEKELDFFDEHTGRVDAFSAEAPAKKATALPPKSNNLPVASEMLSDISGPNVLMSKPEEGTRKPTIGMRSNHTKRSGIGGKKGGLGAQKVNINFAEIEKEAEMTEKMRAQDRKAEEAKSLEAQEEQMNFMRLAYQDLSIKQKQEEEKLKAVDPKKAKQLERLGMGFATRSGVSHSALGDMRTIQQENVQKSNKTFDRDSDDCFNDFGFWAPQSSSPFMYKSASESQGLSSLGADSKDFFGNSKSNETFESKFLYESNTKSPIPYDDKPFEKSYEKSPKKSSSSNSIPSTGAAQQKFGSAKSISSDQYFSDKSDNQWERKSNLSRFEGSTSISSADYFGRNEGPRTSSGIASNIQTPDLDDVKESVRQGVTKVAGKLSSLANGVMSSIQEKYGL